MENLGNRKDYICVEKKRYFECVQGKMMKLAVYGQVICNEKQMKAVDESNRGSFNRIFRL